MSDLANMLREALLADENYRPDTTRARVEEAVRGYELRMRTVRRLGFFVAGAPVVFLAAGLWVFFRPELGDDHRVLGALLVLFGLGGSGLGKLWFHLQVNHVTLLRELKTTQLAVLELGERLAGSAKKAERG